MGKEETLTPDPVERSAKTAAFDVVLKMRGLKFTESSNFVDIVEEALKSFSAQAVLRERADILRQIQYCGFGAMEWRMKLIDKLKASELKVVAMDGERKLDD